MPVTVTVTIRPMLPSEAHAVASLRIETFFQGSGRTAEEDAAALLTLPDDSFQASIVALENDQLAGTALLVRKELDLESDRGPWLAGLAVSRPFRGRGIGARLVKAVEQHAASVGSDRIFLYTLGSEGFYAAIGWTIEERFVWHGQPAVIMTKALR